MLRCTQCKHPWDGPRPYDALAKALRNAIQMGAVHTHVHLLLAELEGVCVNCRFDYAADEIAAASVVARPYKPRLMVVKGENE